MYFFYSFIIFLSLYSSPIRRLFASMKESFIKRAFGVFIFIIIEKAIISRLTYFRRAVNFSVTENLDTNIWWASAPHWIINEFFYI